MTDDRTDIIFREILAGERNAHQVTMLKLHAAESAASAMSKWLDDAQREAATTLAAARARIAELERRVSELARSATEQIHGLEQRLREAGK